jgi:hypothetical protein
MAADPELIIVVITVVGVVVSRRSRGALPSCGLFMWVLQ